MIKFSEPHCQNKSFIKPVTLKLVTSKPVTFKIVTIKPLYPLTLTRVTLKLLKIKLTTLKPCETQTCDTKSVTVKPVKLKPTTPRWYFLPRFDVLVSNKFHFGKVCCQICKLQKSRFLLKTGFNSPPHSSPLQQHWCHGILLNRCWHTLPLVDVWHLQIKTSTILSKLLGPCNNLDLPGMYGWIGLWHVVWGYWVKILLNCLTLDNFQRNRRIDIS